jgi:hypothetical protein
MSGKTEEAFLSAIRLHVTGNFALIRAAEEELIKNKVHAKTCCSRPTGAFHTLHQTWSIQCSYYALV